MTFEFFATCAAGFETLLADELKTLSAKRVRPLKGGVAFYGDNACAYRICLWTRLASRILRVVGRVGAQDADELYDGVVSLPWQDFIGADKTIAVYAHGTNKNLHNSVFSAVKTKDGICDALREIRGSRPDVDPKHPDVAIRVTIHKNKATIYLDYAGESLHRRGYRVQSEQAEAPLKETLAAAMLTWAGWKKDAVFPQVCYDPVCGSATLLLEAAMIACDMAPGLQRERWGFEGLCDYDPRILDALIEEAEDRLDAGLCNAPHFIGSDINQDVLELGQACVKRLGLASLFTFLQASCSEADKVVSEALGIKVAELSALSGWIVANPPYGHRLLTQGLDEFYEALSQGFHALPSSWTLVAITPDELFDTRIGFDAQEEILLYNGALETLVRRYDLSQSFVEHLTLTTLAGKDIAVEVRSGVEQAQQFAARLRKMIKVRRKWAKQQKVSAYRIYDADLPDYALAVDLYEDTQTKQPHLVLTEYKAPAYIDPQKALRRFEDAAIIAQTLLDIAPDALFTRVRQQARGGSQYYQDERTNHVILVKEHDFLFEVDLGAYLDTGLFLDHRIMRQYLYEQARDERFLNLFAYTGTASVYAAAGGAQSTMTIDMSQTYLDWAERNMIRNLELAESAESAQSVPVSHTFCRNNDFIRADVLAWLDHAHCDQAQHGAYDLIYVDPPTFSNSKTMGERTWDIQRDHVRILTQLYDLLSTNGKLYFSGNLRNFKLDVAPLESLGYTITNLTHETIPVDFERNPHIHFCYLLTK